MVYICIFFSAQPWHLRQNVLISFTAFLQFLPLSVTDWNVADIIKHCLQQSISRYDNEQMRFRLIVLTKTTTLMPQQNISARVWKKYVVRGHYSCSLPQDSVLGPQSTSVYLYMVDLANVAAAHGVNIHS